MRWRLSDVQKRYIRTCAKITLISALIYVVLAPFLDRLFNINDLKTMYMVGLTCTSLIAPLAAWRTTRTTIATEEMNERLAQQSLALHAAREKADRAAQAKADFLAMMSHEIRTPLNGVLGLAEILNNRPLPPNEAMLAQKLKSSGEVLLEILNDILDLSKFEAGQMVISPVASDVRAEVNRVGDLFAPVAAEKGINLSVSVDSDVPQFLLFDPVRVRQCLSNLVSNALKFTSAGTVKVHLTRDNVDGKKALARICVVDTGIGMDDQAKSVIFQPFAQGNTSLAQRYDGTGLGLTISRHLASLMGGDLRLVHSSPDMGSEFELTFLVEEAAGTIEEITPQSVPARPVAAAPGEFEGRSFLIVDDTETNRMVLRLMLADTGATISEVADGAAALQSLAENSFDLVFLDVHMPKMTGPEVLNQMRATARHATTPVIVTTAEALPGDRDRFLAMGMDGYVSKPIERRELLAETRRTIAVKRSKVA
ncbi:MAG: response regulator [Pikeienuella sp.]